MYSLLIPEQWCQAKTIYVDVCAFSNGNGSETSPFNKLESAVNEAKVTPGRDHIIMKGGVYPESLKIDEKLTITAEHRSAIIGRSSYAVGWQDAVITVGPHETTNARIYYPSCSYGKNSPILGSGEKFIPLVYLHGLRNPPQSKVCTWCDKNLDDEDSLHNDYLQAEGLLKRLASAGFIAISFDWHKFSAVPGEIADRAIAALTHLNRSNLAWYVKWYHFGLIGHSTGGAAAILAARKLRRDQVVSRTKIAVGLMAPLSLNDGIPVSEPLLVIYGTNDHPCQVAVPFGLYCEANVPKHLVLVEGANHFGYTDGICLDPDVKRPETSDACPYESWPSSPISEGMDNPCLVGGLTGKPAQTLQQRTAGNYLQAFLAYYLQDNNNVRDYLLQHEQDESCAPTFPVDLNRCYRRTLDVYTRWPQNTVNPCNGVEIWLRGVKEGVLMFDEDQSENGGDWYFLGRHIFEKMAVVQIRSPGGCSAIADAAKFVTIESPIDEIIIDNSDPEPNFHLEENWEVTNTGSGINGDNYVVSSDINATASFGLEFSGGVKTSEPKRYFTDLQSLNVVVSVSSCIEKE
jgi:pimeloyl-ACP methyl ester carboxylesterase